MNSNPDFPKGYRYTSDLALFKTAVKYVRDMLDRGEMVILYQFIDVVSTEILIPQGTFAQKYTEISWDNFIDVLNSEIIYILRQIFEEGEQNADIGLQKYLAENNIPEELAETILNLKAEKCKYVNELLGKEKKRYDLKKRSLMQKLLEMDVELNRTIDDEGVIYAAIRMSTTPKIVDKEITAFMGGIFSGEKESITFVCDKSDIEYMIEKLQKIKQML